MKKVDLQEQALHLEVPIYHPANEEGTQKELTVLELKDALAAKQAKIEEERAERDKAAAKAREPLPEADEDELDPADPADAPPPVASSPVNDPHPERLQMYGLGRPSDADRELAKKHGYPIAVPGGKPYKTCVSFNCSLGGGLRPMGSVVILTDAQAVHKADYIKPVK